MWPFRKIENGKGVIKVQEEFLNDTPEDIQRFALRELKKSLETKTKYMDYWDVFNYLTRKNECDLSKLSDEIIKGFEFCTAEISAGKQLVWICPNCYIIVGFFKTPYQLKPGQFGIAIAKAMNMLKSICPECGTENTMVLKSNFLLSGKTFLYVVSTEFDIKNKIQRALNKEEQGIELWHIMGLMEAKHSEKYNENMERKLFGISFNDIVRKNGIHKSWLLSYDKDGKNVWTAFGRFTKSEFGNIKTHKEKNIDKVKLLKMMEESEKLEKKGLFKEANNYLDKLLETMPHPAILEQKALIYSKLGNYHQTVACLDKALAMGSDNKISIHNMKANVYFTKMNEYEKAVEELDKILAIDANNTTALNNKGFVLYNHLFKRDEAIKCFKKAANLGDSDSEKTLQDLGLTQDK